MRTRKTVAFHSNGGFSLVEILSVIAIVGILAAASLGSLGTSMAHQLNSGGNKVVSLVNLARQDSIAKHTMTALILLTGTNQADVDNRVFVIVDFDPITSTWRQVTKWESLPSGLVVDNAATTKPLLNAPVTFPTLTYLGQSIEPSSYACQVFLPRGQLLLTPAGLPPLLRVVSGSNQNGTVVYTSGAKGGTLNNYYDVTINPYTGMPKVTRP